MYKLLLNQTYLYLLQHPHEAINKSKLSEQLSMTRATVRKELSEIDLPVKNTLNIKDFHNEIGNKYERALAIIADIDMQGYTLTEMSRLLHVSDKTLGKYYSYKPRTKNNTLSNSGVYGIFKDKECIYIGFSTNIYQRFMQHQSNIDNKRSSSKLYKYCIDHHITSNQLRFVVLCQSNDIEALRRLERNLYREFTPVGNDFIE